MNNYIFWQNPKYYIYYISTLKTNYISMADSILKSQETQPQVETQKTSKTRMKLAALAMWTIISWTQAQASDLLTQCDFNHDWKISTRKTYKADWVSRALAKKEFKCKLDYENAQLDQENAQLDQEIVEWKQELEKLQKIKKILDSKK